MCKYSTEMQQIWQHHKESNCLFIFSLFFRNDRITRKWSKGTNPTGASCVKPGKQECCDQMKKHAYRLVEDEYSLGHSNL